MQQAWWMGHHGTFLCKRWQSDTVAPTFYLLSFAKPHILYNFEISNQGNSYLHIKANNWRHKNRNGPVANSMELKVTKQVKNSRPGRLIIHIWAQTADWFTVSTTSMYLSDNCAGTHHPKGWLIYSRRHKQHHPSFENSLLSKYRWLTITAGFV